MDMGECTQSVRSEKTQSTGTVEANWAPPIEINEGYSGAQTAAHHPQNAEAWSHLHFHVSRRWDTFPVSPRVVSSKSQKVKKGGGLAQSTAERGARGVYIPTVQPAARQAVRRQTTGKFYSQECVRM